MARIYANAAGGKTLGTAAADEIIGSNFSDHIFAGSGADQINAGFGNDVIVGGDGGDAINGGMGSDTVSYYDAPASNSAYGVIIDLHNGRGDNSDAEGDTYISIENATGSSHWDTIWGSEGNNVLNGLAGNDFISGGRGADTMDGGDGIDMLYYGSRDGQPAPASGVTVNLLNNTASGGDAQGDVIANFENVTGTAFGDTIYGSNGDNVLEGEDIWETTGGDDFLYGLGGRDTIRGRDGDDVVHGGSGNDTLDGGEGDDVLTGGTEADTFRFDIQAYASGVHSGDDHIMDFQDGVDRLRFDVLTPANGLSELTLTQVGSNSVITFDDTDASITLFDVNVSQLTAADFDFV